MLFNYKEAVNIAGSEYKLCKAVAEQSIFKQEDGIYSTQKYESELGVILKKYPKAVLTGEYAFYKHGLTNVIPEKYDLATISKAARIGSIIKIYDKERMLIELLRNKNSMPYDLYKEIIMNYREIINDLEIWRIQEYASVFPKSKMISKALDEEVM